MSREVVSWEAIVRGEEEEAGATIVVPLIEGREVLVLLGWAVVRAVGRGVDEEAVVRVVGGRWSGSLEGGGGSGVFGRVGGFLVFAGGIRIAGDHLEDGRPGWQ